MAMKTAGGDVGWCRGRVCDRDLARFAIIPNIKCTSVKSSERIRVFIDASNLIHVRIWCAVLRLDDRGDGHHQKIRVYRKSERVPMLCEAYKIHNRRNLLASNFPATDDELPIRSFTEIPAEISSCTVQDMIVSGNR